MAVDSLVRIWQPIVTIRLVLAEQIGTTPTGATGSVLNCYQRMGRSLS